MSELVSVCLKCHPHYEWCGPLKEPDIGSHRDSDAQTLIVTGLDRLAGRRSLELIRSFLGGENAADRRILVLAPPADDQTLGLLLHLGIDGFVDNSLSLNEINSALKALANNSVYFSTSIRTRIFRGISTKPHSDLAHHEISIWMAKSLGFTDSEIGEISNVSTEELHATTLKLRSALKIHQPRDYLRTGVKHGLISLATSRSSQAPFKVHNEEIKQEIQIQGGLRGSPASNRKAKIERIRQIQKRLHLLPIDSPEAAEIITLCHDVVNTLSGPILEESLRAALSGKGTSNKP